MESLARCSSSLNWHAGASCDRTTDVRILDRFIVRGDLGNPLWDRPGLRLLTSCGLSWTDRVEETEDSEKENRVAGARANVQYSQTFGDNTTFDNDTVFNASLAERKDRSAEMTSPLSVSMNKRLSLRVSLRWLDNNEPALEDVDVKARVALRDPEGTAAARPAPEPGGSLGTSTRPAPAVISVMALAAVRRDDEEGS